MKVGAGEGVDVIDGTTVGMDEMATAGWHAARKINANIVILAMDALPRSNLLFGTGDCFSKTRNDMRILLFMLPDKLFPF